MGESMNSISGVLMVLVSLVSISSSATNFNCSLNCYNESGQFLGTAQCDSCEDLTRCQRNCDIMKTAGGGKLNTKGPGRTVLVKTAISGVAPSGVKSPSKAESSPKH